MSPIESSFPAPGSDRAPARLGQSLQFKGEISGNEDLQVDGNVEGLIHLEDRKLVERAKGILQRKHHTTEEDAYFRLRNQSRRLRRPMRELAEAIILAEDLEQP